MDVERLTEDKIANDMFSITSEVLEQMTQTFTLSETANARIFPALGGFWLEVNGQTARQVFADTRIELCIFHDDSESLIESDEELEVAISDNQMIVIYLGDQNDKENR